MDVDSFVGIEVIVIMFVCGDVEVMCVLLMCVCVLSIMCVCCGCC